MKTISLAILLVCFIAVEAQAPYLTSNYFGAAASSINPLTSVAGPGTSSSTNLPYIPPSFTSQYAGNVVNSFPFSGMNQAMFGTSSQSSLTPPIATMSVSPTPSSSSGIPNFQGLPSGTPRPPLLGGTQPIPRLSPPLPGIPPPYPGGSLSYPGGPLPYPGPASYPRPTPYSGGPAPYLGTPSSHPGGIYPGLGSLTLRYQHGSGYYSGFAPRRPSYGGTFVAGPRSPIILQGGYNYNLGNTGGFLGLGRNGLWILGLLLVVFLIARDDK